MLFWRKLYWLLRGIRHMGLAQPKGIAILKRHLDAAAAELTAVCNEAQADQNAKGN